MYGGGAQITTIRVNMWQCLVDIIFLFNKKRRPARHFRRLTELIGLLSDVSGTCNGNSNEPIDEPNPNPVLYIEITFVVK